jgi:hypothetical protein
MNCRVTREHLNDSLASRQVIFAGDALALHLQACPGCKAYYEAQANLFRSVDSGIRNIVNVIAPPALLPRVRERISGATPGRTGVQVLVPSLAGVLIVCGLLVLMQVRARKIRERGVASIPTFVLRQKPLTTAEIQPLADDATGAPDGRRNVPLARSQSSTSAFSVAPPVMVDPQEAQGLTRLADAVQEDPEFGKAYLDSLNQASNQGTKIEPLSISQIKIPAIAEENQ